MRTTITIDEQVYREAKAQAARSARTVSQVIEDAVRAALRAEHDAPERIDPLPTFGRGGVLPGVDLADRSALLDLMDAGTRAHGALMRCVDVNVLVYAHREDVAEHHLHRSWLDLARRGPEPLGVPTVVASGFLRIVTHPRIFEMPSPLDEALSFLDVLLRSPASVPLTPGPGHWAAFTDLCQRIGARGNQIPDAYLAAIAMEHGATFVSADRGFGGYPGLRWLHPADDTV